MAQGYMRITGYCLKLGLVEAGGIEPTQPVTSSMCIDKRP
ncbi:hypothetical protein HMPREF3156_00668 [Neisseria sp. HMSC06F02]|nr:hypothetical protein HMPREF3156_00668 [Neisseria sp. HMSC06F02]